MDYECLKLALLKRYDFTEFRYRRRFRDVKPEGQESPGQFIVRLKNYLTKWVKLAKVEESFDGVVELMVREQFTNACPKELSVYLNERSPKTLDELVTWAEQHLKAHNKKLSSSQSRREDVKNGSKQRGKLGKALQRDAVFPMWWRRTPCHRMHIQDARWASQRGREIRKEIFMPEVWRLWA